MNENPNNQQQLNIELPDDISGGIYSNFVIVGHSGAEFVLDFVQVLPMMPTAKVRSRIVMSPFHTKRLMMALKENIEKYERAFGQIPAGDKNQPPFPPPFGGGPAGIA